MSSSMPDPGATKATAADATKAFGDVDEATIAAILELSPTVAEVEEAAAWMSGQGENLTRRHPPSGVVEAILDLVDTGSEEEERQGS